MKIIEIYNVVTGEVVKSVDVSSRSKRDIERIRDGMEINMHHDFSTRIVSTEPGGE